MTNPNPNPSGSSNGYALVYLLLMILTTRKESLVCCNRLVASCFTQGNSYLPRLPHTSWEPLGDVLISSRRPLEVIRRFDHIVDLLTLWS